MVFFFHHERSKICYTSTAVCLPAICFVFSPRIFSREMKLKKEKKDKKKKRHGVCSFRWKLTHAKSRRRLRMSDTQKMVGMEKKKIKSWNKSKPLVSSCFWTAAQAPLCICALFIPLTYGGSTLRQLGNAPTGFPAIIYINHDK